MKGKHKLEVSKDGKYQFEENNPFWNAVQKKLGKLKIGTKIIFREEGNKTISVSTDQGSFILKSE